MVMEMTSLRVLDSEHTLKTPRGHLEHHKSEVGFQKQTYKQHPAWLHITEGLKVTVTGALMSKGSKWQRPSEILRQCLAPSSLYLRF